MINRFIAIALLSILFSLWETGSALAQPDDRAGVAPAASLQPVTLTVVDSETGEPVTSFSYRFWFSAPGVSRPYNKNWQPVESRSGTVVIQAPRACRLTVDVEWKDTRAGTDEYHEFVIRSNDNARRVVVKLERGLTVHGTVRDVDTKQPIAGVTLVPGRMGPHHDAPGQERRAISDKDGRYELHGVNPTAGVWASHPRYRHVDAMDADKPEESLVDKFLKKHDDPILHGTVRDSSGQPLEGVTVSSGDQRVQTARDGTFALPGPSYNGVEFAKEGFVSRDFIIVHELRKNGNITLERQVPLRGKVLGPDDQPVENFEILAGPGKSEKDRLSVPSVKRAFKDRAGQFSLGLDWRGSTWIGVRAQGFGLWELWTDVPPAGLTQVVRLQPGVSVSGKILAPAAGLSKIQARLVPRRNLKDGRGLGSDWAMKEWAERSATVTADGILRFDHVRPGGYTLDFSGPGVTPLALAIDVPSSGLDLGRVRFAGRGRITGRVFRSEEHGGGPWRFADGYARLPGRPYDEKIEILSDEDGRFSVDGAFTGLVKVGFPYMVFDVVSADEWAVQVVEGQTTDVVLLDPDGRRALPAEVRIGDDSLAQYKSGTGLGAQRKVAGVTTGFFASREEGAEPFAPLFKLDLAPRSRARLSFADPEWKELDFNKQIALSDVSPGAYRLRLLDSLGPGEFNEAVLFEQEITMPTDALPIKVSLGAGSITGRILGASEGLEKPEVIAVPQGVEGSLRRARCGDDGSFCARYLDPGSYALFFHDVKNGWARVENVAVAANVTDVGEHRLAPGGAIHGSISFKQPSPVPDAIVATGPSNVSLTIPFESYSSFDDFELTGLWPGTWTIAVRRGGEVLATAEAEIAGTEKVTVAMSVGDDRRP
jgi:hypothetical protein